MKKFIIITIVSLTTATGILSSQTNTKPVAKPEVATAVASSTSAFRKDLGQAD